MEQHEARAPQHTPSRTGRPAAGRAVGNRPAAAPPVVGGGRPPAKAAQSGQAAQSGRAAQDGRAAQGGRGARGAQGGAGDGQAAPGSRDAQVAPDAGPAIAETSTVYRAGARRVLPGPLAALVRRLPAAKLTGLGCALLTTLALLVMAFLDRLLAGGSPTVYGVCFVLAGAAGALWVRPYDLVVAPVTLPIAYTVGCLPVAGAGGSGSLLMGVFTVLAVNAGWLYLGTALSVLLVGFRKCLLILRRRAQRPDVRQDRDRRPRDRRPGPERERRQSGRKPAGRPLRPQRSPRCSEAAQARSQP